MHILLALQKGARYPNFCTHSWFVWQLLLVVAFPENVLNNEEKKVMLFSTREIGVVSWTGEVSFVSHPSQTLLSKRGPAEAREMVRNNKLMNKITLFRIGSFLFYAVYKYFVWFFQGYEKRLMNITMAWIDKDNRIRYIRNLFKRGE